MVGVAAIGSIVVGAAEVGVTSCVLYGADRAVFGVLYGAAVVQQLSGWHNSVCAQQQLGQLEQQRWVLPVRWIVRRTVRGSVSNYPVAGHTVRYVRNKARRCETLAEGVPCGSWCESGHGLV